MFYSLESFFPFISLQTAVKIRTPTRSLLEAWAWRLVQRAQGFWAVRGPPSGADWTPLSAKLDSGPQSPPGARQVTGVAVLHLYLQDFCSSPEDSQAQVSRASTARARVFLTPERPCSSSWLGWTLTHPYIP